MRTGRYVEVIQVKSRGKAKKDDSVLNKERCWAFKEMKPEFTVDRVENTENEAREVNKSLSHESCRLSSQSL